MWGQHCADLAWQHCPDLPGCSPPPLCPGSGSCCEANGSPACDNETCCEAVCAIDPYCCDQSIGEWDACCADLAGEICPHPSVPGTLCKPQPPPVECPPSAAGNCCTNNGTPGCDDPECCAAVCQCDPFCCAVAWDNLCVNGSSHNDCLCPGNCGAWNLCENFCIISDPICHFTEPKGDCFTPGGTGCLDFDCCEMVCACDPFCCFVEWDALCVGPNPETGCSAVNLCCHLHNCNPADLTLDNIVGVEDLLILLQSWGDCPNIAEHCPDPADCPADFAPPGGDLTVGVADLLFLLQNWG